MFNEEKQSKDKPAGLWLDSVETFHVFRISLTTSP